MHQPHGRGVDHPQNPGGEQGVAFDQVDDFLHLVVRFGRYLQELVGDGAEQGRRLNRPGNFRVLVRGRHGHSYIFQLGRPGEERITSPVLTETETVRLKVPPTSSERGPSP